MASNIELIKLRMAEGVWHGALTNPGQSNWQPNIEVTHLDVPLDGIEVEEDSSEGHWNVRIPIPASLARCAATTMSLICASIPSSSNSLGGKGEIGDFTGDGATQSLEYA